MPSNASQPPADRVEAIVTLADKDVHRIGTIAKALAKKGFDVSHVLEGSGIIAGTADPGTFESLRDTKGVASIEVSGDVSIPSPGSDIQ